MTRRIIVYNPEVKRVHDVNTSAVTFGELVRELSLMPENFKYVCSYKSNGQSYKTALDLTATPLPDTDYIEIYFFPKKNMSGNIELVENLADEYGLDATEAIELAKKFFAILLDDIASKTISAEEKARITADIESIMRELGYL